MVPAPARSEAAATNTPSLLKASGMRMIDALNGLEKVRCVQQPSRDLKWKTSVWNWL